VGTKRSRSDFLCHRMAFRDLCPVRNGGLSPSPGLGPFCSRVYNWLDAASTPWMTAWLDGGKMTAAASACDGPGQGGDPATWAHQNVESTLRLLALP
jgi:hypothetical protein